jgi:hypothetical protein
MFRAVARLGAPLRPAGVHLPGGMLIFQARTQLRHKSAEKPWRLLDKMNLFQSR